MRIQNFEKDVGLRVGEVRFLRGAELFSRRNVSLIRAEKSSFTGS